MSLKGIPKSNSPAWIRLGCGHAVLYSPPVPEPDDELTCSVCGEATVAA